MRLSLMSVPMILVLLAPRAAAADAVAGSDAAEAPMAAGETQQADLPPPVTMPASGRLAEVFFLRESDKILLPGKQSLDAAAKLLLAHPDVHLLIEGNTDALGEDLYNRCLSSWRALAVQRYLVQRGVDVARLSIRAASKDRPVTANTTGKGRRQNRRVDLVISAPAVVPGLVAVQ